MSSLLQNSDEDEITGGRLETRSASRLFVYLRPFKLRASFAVGLLLCSVGVAIYAPRLLGRIVEDALVAKNQALLWQLIGIYLGLEIFSLVAKFCSSTMLQGLGQDVLHQLRQNLFSRLIRMPVPFYDRNPTGRIVTRITNDTNNLMEVFGPGFVNLLADIVLITGTFAAMFWMNWQLGLIAVCLFPVMGGAMTYFAGRLRTAYREARYSLSSLNAFFAERVTGMPTVQLLGMENKERENFERLSRDYYHRQMASVHVFAFFHPTITVLSAASIAGVLYFGGNFARAGTVAIGEFVSFLAYVQLMFQPVRGLTEKYNIYQNAMSSAERIFSLLAAEEEANLREQPSTKISLNGKIDFQDVWFSYSEKESETTKWALAGATFTIEPGQRTAVVGHTGAGKSTLLALLFRFYEFQRGHILLDGKELSSIPKSLLRRRVGFVQQEVIIFAGTVRENLALLGHNLSDQEILAAAESTGFDAILRRMPQGLDSVLDERGSNLSQGERQVLAFTRVILQNPDILVLDEATAQIDSKSEQDIQRAMAKATEGRSSIIIAHRLSTIQSADQILVFDHGRVIERGTHAELLASRGAYFAFSQSQDALQSTADLQVQKDWFLTPGSPQPGPKALNQSYLPRP